MATGDKLVNLDELKLVYDKLHVPSVQVQIPTGQWSGSSTRTYTVNATNVTADTIVDWAMDSSINYLKADLTVTPGSGTIQFSTTAIPAGTINVTLFFPGVNGEVVIQTLADVYSKSQVDQKISQSTASLLSGLFGNLAHETINITSTVTLDQILDSTIQNVSAEKTYGIDVRATMAESPGANRNLILMWSNATRKFAFAIIINFNGLWYAKRGNTDTFAVTRIV